MNKDMMKAGKTVLIVLALVVAVVGGMKVVSKLCCKSHQHAHQSTECCQKTSCECCEPQTAPECAAETEEATN